MEEDGFWFTRDALSPIRLSSSHTGNLIEDEPPLSKALVTKLATESDDKPSYDAAMAGPEASLWRKELNEELDRIIELDI